MRTLLFLLVADAKRLDWMIDMLKSDLISIIIPVYQVERYLNRCIESIVRQTHRNIEILLVDDGSIDHCPAMCDQWAEKDARIRVIHKENGGLSDARNAGLAIASGDYIGFVDSDDWVSPEMYERLLQAIRRDGSDIAACSVKMVWEDGIPDRLLTVCDNCVMDRQAAQAALLQETTLKQPVWYKLYRRETVAGIFFEKGKFHEDVFWSYQVIGNAKRVSIIDHVGYYYWQRADSIMGEQYSLKRLDAMEAYCRRYGYIKANFHALENLAAISILQNCIYNGQMAQLYLPKNEKKQAFRYLKQIYREYDMDSIEKKNLKSTHRLWLKLAGISLELSCRIKNLLRIGL